MAIKAYTGRMGSGKSYEVVTVVILNAIRAGRRIVSNIAGLNIDAMQKHLISEGADESGFGEIVSVDHNQVMDRKFWRTDTSEDSFIQAGVFLVLDEVWRFWNGFAASTPDYVMNFFRMHRHFVHETSGYTCEVVLITQDIYDLGRKVRSVIEETYQMEKLTAIGSVKHYRVDIYAGALKARDTPFRSLQRTYNPDFFVFYQSHSQKKEDGVEAVEVNIDDRGNIFKSKFFRIIIPLAIGILFYSIYHVYGFFQPKEAKKEKEKSEKVTENKPAQSMLPVSVSSAPVPIDAISRMFSSNVKARLAYAGMIGEKRIAKVEFIESDKVIDMYSEGALHALGWRLYFSQGGDAAILSNGRENRIVSIEVRHRLPRIDYKMDQK
jgi:zona occludens toxin